MNPNQNKAPPIRSERKEFTGTARQVPKRKQARERRRSLTGREGGWGGEGLNGLDDRGMHAYQGQGINQIRV